MMAGTPYFSIADRLMHTHTHMNTHNCTLIKSVRRGLGPTKVIV